MNQHDTISNESTETISYECSQFLMWLWKKKEISEISKALENESIRINKWITYALTENEKEFLSSFLENRERKKQKIVLDNTH